MNSSYQNLPARVLVTGATGIVGIPLIRTLLKHGSSVIGLSRSSIRPPQLDGAKSYGHFQGDVRRGDAVSDAAKDVDLIVHTAGAVHGAVSSVEEFFSVNVEGTRNVIAAAKEHAVPVVHISSVNALGHKTGKLSDPYAESKSIGEDLVMDAIADGLSGAILRPAMVFGHEVGIAGLLVERILAGRLRILPAPERPISPVWSYDLARAVLSAAKPEFSGKIFTVAGPSQTTGEFVERVGQHVGERTPFLSIRARYLAYGLRMAWRARRLTRWTPPISVESLLTGSSYDGSADAATLNISFTPLEQIFGPRS